MQEIEVEDIVHHSDYNKGRRQENDVALIRLKKPATLGRKRHFHFLKICSISHCSKGIFILAFVQPVCLPQGKVLERDPDKEGYAIVAGWGRTLYCKLDK